YGATNRVTSLAERVFFRGIVEPGTRWNASLPGDPPSSKARWKTASPLAPLHMVERGGQKGTPIRITIMITIRRGRRHLTPAPLHGMERGKEEKKRGSFCCPARVGDQVITLINFDLEV